MCDQDICNSINLCVCLGIEKGHFCIIVFLEQAAVCATVPFLIECVLGSLVEEQLQLLSKAAETT